MLSLKCPDNVPEERWTTIMATLRHAESGCVESDGPKTNQGYNRVSILGKNLLLHRLIYTAAKGDIPKGLELHHVCENPGCVNPDHLRPVTHRENVLFGASPAAKQARQTHCINGHPLSGDNLIVDGDGHRHCKACGRVRYMEHYYRNHDKMKKYMRDYMRMRKAFLKAHPGERFSINDPKCLTTSS